MMRRAAMFILRNFLQGLGVGIGLLVALPVAEVVRGLLT